MDASVLQRAFEIAATGQYGSLMEIRRALKSEGFPEWALSAHLGGRQVKADLRRRWEAARAGAEASRA